VLFRSLDIGVARAVGSIAFALVIGLLMAFIFRCDEKKRHEAALQMPPPPAPRRRLWQTTLYFAGMILFLVFSDWANTNDVTIAMTDGTTVTANVRYRTADNMDVKVYQVDGKLSTEVTRLALADIAGVRPVPSLAMTVHGVRWYLAGAMGLAVLLMLWTWFTREEVHEWLGATWDFGKMIVPLLFGGVFITGFVGALIPEAYVATLVGGNGVFANLFASLVGALWYFATLTEIPIVETLMRLGMGKGPALALLLAGPALSLPSMLVIYKIVGFWKTFVFCGLTVVLSALVGMIFGIVAG
jgi:uncharacterized membrane protein YraQ (UPF0718 family)